MDSLPSGIPSVQAVLQSGEPFVPFSEFSVQTLHHLLSDDASGWLQGKLQEGKPFVIRGFSQLDSWDKTVLNNESLATLSSSGAIPVRNCQTGRDVKMRLRDLFSSIDHPRINSTKESLYAKDLHCPSEWIRALDAVLPPSLTHLGSFDLFRVLPKEIAPEVLMAYVGTRKSFSGFHRCFSGTVALNLMIESEGPGLGSLCFGSDRSSQSKYDTFMEELEKSSHIDWANISLSQLKSADFPVYVTQQEPGDLVIFPAATSHQIWNVGPMVTKVVWNILHTSSFKSFFDYVQPAYQRQCHTDTGRVPLVLINALSKSLEPKETRLLLEIFQWLVDDEDTGQDAFPIKLVDTQGAVIECNFCGLTIWNRHLHCEKCGDFDLCLTCFVSGRSCKHVAEYTWAELFPRQHCQDLITATREKLALGPYKPSAQTQKSLGELAVAAADVRQQTTERLCHVCRDSHPVWKGVTCAQCAAFFCFRGLYRHFDVDLLAFLRNKETWNCYKCRQMCNCRCCHFTHPYQSKDKPVRARIKPVDSRGRILGFVDNVFDQKRGKRASLATHSASTQPGLTPRGQKRLRIASEDSGENSLHSNGNPYLGSFSGPTNGRSGLSEQVPTDTARPNHVLAEPGSNGHASLKGQLRISDLVEDRVSPVGTPVAPRIIRPPIAVPHLWKDTTPSGQNGSNNLESPSSRNEESISTLEKKLEALRKYASELLELSLFDSYAKTSETISQLEAQVEQKKRQKAEVLFSNLSRDFPELASIAREEARRCGL